MKLSAAAAAAATAALLFASQAQATVITSTYTPLGGSSWVVDLALINDGSPSVITNFAVDFPSFTNLVLLASPSTWDTILIQPDVNLPDPGYLDSLVIDAGDALSTGLLRGFRVQFDFAGTPGALPFVITDRSFTPLFQGVTVANFVPEPSSLLLAALGLGIAGFGMSRKRRANAARDESTAARDLELCA